MRRLYFGDCLDVMREDMDAESVDLIYLDPPFNSKRLYNAFIGGAQWQAFDDTWRWYEAVEDFHQVASEPGPLARTMEGLRLIHDEGPTLAYLAYMANRLRECWRVLKPTGSLYLHCDPTLSHSLKLLCDGIFRGGGDLRNEIVWRRTGAKGLASRRFASNHDVILAYGKGDQPQWNAIYEPHDASYIESFYRHVEKGTGRRYALDNLVNPNKDRPNLTYEFLGVQRVWRWTRERMQRAYDDGLIHQTRPGAVPRLKRYLDEQPGRAVDDLWADIRPALGGERLGYPTQKPVALLERILKASSNPGDVVLDPFCGCGTTIHAAQNLDRQWIGIDICVNACKVIERRLRSHFDSLWTEIEFIGFPKTRDDARELASLDAFRFERWAASLVDGMEFNKRQRGDGGIDGWGRLAIQKGRFIDLVSQVKGGSTSPGDVQAFNGARQQAGADLGIFTCFEERVTARMRDAAASTGRFMEIPRVQIYTVDDYFEGRAPKLPLAA